MSQMTRGRLIASHSRVKLDGVCDHPDRSDARETVVERVLYEGLVGLGGGRATFVGLVWLAVDVRVARFRGDSCAVAVATAVSGSGNSWG